MGLGLTDCVLFFFFSILVRLRMKSTPRGIGRGRRGRRARRRSKGVSDGSGDGTRDLRPQEECSEEQIRVPAVFFSCLFSHTRHRRKRRLISLMPLIFSFIDSG